MDSFKDREKKRQLRLYESKKDSLWEGAENMGGYNFCDYRDNVIKTEYYPFVLQHSDSDKNLFYGIRNDVKEYFSRYNIKWWREDEDGYAPTGHFLSSQNHCLNHLFALRNNEDAVLTMINGIQNRFRFKRVLPVPIDYLDRDSFIGFEFVYNNISLLGESHETRGSKCTSIDAVIYAEDTDNRKWLIPIEWKYTETYDLSKTANKNSIKRYIGKVSDSSNLKSWNKIYESDPMYELARQTLLVEKIIASNDNEFQVDDYMHLVVIPEGNIDLRGMISELYIPTLKDKEKLIISTPEYLLRVIKSPHIDYVRERYW